MAQQRALPQSKETLLQSYNKRLKDDIKSIMDNFTEIIKTARVRGHCAEAMGEGETGFPWGLGPGLAYRDGDAERTCGSNEALQEQVSR